MIRIVTRIVSNQKVESHERDDAHLQDIEDGCGCAEVWEHMNKQRDETATDP